MAIAPEVLWAQRSNAQDSAKNILYLTVRIPDSVNAKIDLTASSLTIDSDSEDSKDHYSLAIDFYKEIDVENSHRTQSGNAIKFVLRKAEKMEEFWPRLTKEKVKYHYIKTDFDKWVDEDEQDEQEDQDEAFGMPPGMDMSALGGMGGMQGMGGMPGMGGMGGMPDMSALGGMGGMGGMPGMPDMGGFDMEEMAKENPQLNNLRDENGQFDFSKLASMAGAADPSVNTSNATEGDFSSSEEEEDSPTA